MTLADLPVLNPSTPGKEAKRSVLVAALFAIFGAFYALARAAASAPPDVTSSTDPVFSAAFPRGWGIAQTMWTGAATWPARLAAGDYGTTLAVVAVVVLAIALIMVMHPDILARQGPQYVSPARRITTVVIALVLAFLIFFAVGRIDDIFSTPPSMMEGLPRRRLFGFAALSAIVFGGIWSFVGPKDFGRRIPLRISHGALGGLGVWAAVTFATMLSREPRAFLSGSLDTFYTLLTVDAANGTPGATAGWAISSDVLTAAVAMAVAGALLIVTAPQSLGPGNRRGAALVTGILGALLAVVGLTTSTVTKQRAETVDHNVVTALELSTTAPARAIVLLAGQELTPAVRVLRANVIPSATRDDCLHPGNGEDALPAATAANVARLASWLQSQGDVVTGATIRAQSCLSTLRALRWDIEATRDGIFLASRPERTLALTYYLSAPTIAAARPAALRRYVAALGDSTRFELGSEGPRVLADLARFAGDTATEMLWRQRILSPQSAGQLARQIARPAFVDGTISGRIQAPGSGWRVGLIVAPEPTSGEDPLLSAPRNEGALFAAAVTAVDVGTDGRFLFTGLRDGWYMLALLSPEGTGANDLRTLAVRGDPGVFRLAPARKALDVGTVVVAF
jgi:hypothetical protein